MITERSSESWFSRIGDAIKGVVIGAILFFVAIVLLFWNEGRAVKRYKDLQEGRGAVVSIDAGTVDSAHEGSLVHLTGEATTDETLSDGDFPIAEKALRLRRTVEMYQWKENRKDDKRKKVGGGTETVTTYSYEMVWSAEAIDSSGFKEQDKKNPPMDLKSKSVEAGQAKIGAFSLPGTLVGRISNFTPVPIDATTDNPFEEGAPDRPPLPTGFKATKDMFYRGDPAQAKLGDVRVRFDVVKPTTVSIIAQQTGNSFRPYATETGGSLEELALGQKSADEMFAAAEKSNETMTWILRAVGFFLMFIGLTMVGRPFVVFADILPLAGDLLGMGIGLAAFVMAGVFSLVTIAVGWLFYRPLLGVTLIVLAVGGFVALFTLGRKRRVAKKASA